jgi:hypothetical protein
MFQPYLAIFRQLFTVQKLPHCSGFSQYISMLLHIFVHSKICLLQNKTLSQFMLFSFFGVHTCAPFVCMYTLVRHMSLVYRLICRTRIYGMHTDSSCLRIYNCLWRTVVSLNWKRQSLNQFGGGGCVGTYMHAHHQMQSFVDCGIQASIH